MSWWAIGAMFAGAYGFKALGLFGLSRVDLSGPLASVVTYLPAAAFAGLICQQLTSDAPAEIMWTRWVGAAAGGVAVWRKAPVPVVIVVSAGVAAVLRAIV